MGGTFLVEDNLVSQIANWQAHQDRESEDCSFASSSLSDLKDDIDDCMYDMLEGGASPANFEDQTFANTSLNLPIIKDEDAHSFTITKDIFFFNPLSDPKTSQYPLGSHRHDEHSVSTPLASCFLRDLKQAHDQTLDVDDACQVPCKSELLLPLDALHESSPLFVAPVSISNDLDSQPLLDQYGVKQARDIHGEQCPTQPSNDALETTSHGTYMPHLVCTSFATLPTLPSITSTSSGPITTFLANNTSTISKSSFMCAASLPLNSCHNIHFINDSELILPFPRTLASRSSNRVTKAKSGSNHIALKKKRKRTRSRKNIEELESQRMTHIAVERNRRRQMNQHLTDLRSLMPCSYIQRGDQASIVGGAIRLVEELEQVLKSLHLQKQTQGGVNIRNVSQSHFDDDKSVSINEDSYACLQSSLVNVQVEIVSLDSILVKIVAPKRQSQLLQTLQALTFLSLNVIHLNITTLDISILYYFHLKLQVENDCQFQTAFELAKSIEHAFQTPKG